MSADQRAHSLTDMSARFDIVTIDTARPDDAAAFWCAALGLVEAEREDGDRWILLAEPDGTRRIGLQRGESRSGGVHLDLACDPAAFDSEVQRIVALGAVALSPARHEPYGSIVNLSAPDGTPFDLCAYL